MKIVCIYTRIMWTSFYVQILHDIVITRDPNVGIGSIMPFFTLVRSFAFERNFSRDKKEQFDIYMQVVMSYCVWSRSVKDSNINPVLYRALQFEGWFNVQKAMFFYISLQYIYCVNKFRLDQSQQNSGNNNEH